MKKSDMKDAMAAHPLFRDLIAAALARRDATPPGLRRMLDEAADAAAEDTLDSTA